MGLSIDLSDSTTIVTGAGRGIGRTIATTFAEAGSTVVAAARTESEIAETVELVEERGSDGLAVRTDLADVDDIDGLIDATVEAFGAPDVLINNAGANISGPPLEHTVEELDTMWAVNLRGLFVLSQRFAQTFRESPLDSGRIVNIASVAAHVGVPAMTAYGGTKSGIFGITQGLAAELAGDGITVNSVSPGLVSVDRTDRVIAEHGDALFDFDRIPVGRVGEPADVANACAFLASDLASYVTGEDLLVDGGVDFTAGLYK